MLDKPPDYPDYTRKRIERARQKAYLATRYAWSMGRSHYTGADLYTVRSTNGEYTHQLSAHSNPKCGGYCYSLGGKPVVFIKCTCDAFMLHTQPCWHGARVQLRLEQEYKQEERKQEDGTEVIGATANTDENTVGNARVPNEDSPF